MAASMKYIKTLMNLSVGPETKCVVQGFTGKSSTFHSKLSMDMGTNIVGGISPGKGGQTHLGKPVFDSVKEAVKHVKPHATAVFVPPLLAADAIIDAIEQEVPLIVSVAEGVPIRDQMRVMAALHSQEKSRLVGANSPGLMNPAGCRLGISPPIIGSPGPVGIASRSGTLSYEASASCKHIGQSTILGLGGDFYPGTRMTDALDFFMQDEATKGIVLVGEVGGEMEEELERWFTRHKQFKRPGKGTETTIKPIVGFVAGRNVPPGQTFGHSGAIWRDGRNSADLKRRAWRRIGIRVVDTVVDVGPAIEEELKKRGEL